MCNAAPAGGRVGLVLALLPVVLVAVAPAVHCGPAAGAAPRRQPSAHGEHPTARDSSSSSSSSSFTSGTTHGVVSPVARRLQQQCTRGTHRCGRRCVPDTDPKTCGKRCSPCPAPASGNGVATCSAAGICTISCRKGFQASQECATPKSCKPVCRRVCSAGQQANARDTACVVCPTDTFKPSAGVAACSPCPAGKQARGQQARDHDAVDDCKPAVLSCPAGQEADATAESCRVCGIGFYKDADGPGPCARCPHGTAAAGDLAEDHDDAQDCYSISCPPGKERDTMAGGCRVCQANTFKADNSPGTCTPCPPGAVTQGTAAADHDTASDCIEQNPTASCPAGQQLDAGSKACVVCPANMIKPAAGREACTQCPDGTRTLGQQPADHDDPSDCIPGGLLPSGNRTASTLQEAMEDFDSLFERSLNNTGKGGGKGGGGKGRGGKGGSGSGTRACLYECNVLGGSDPASSKAVAHLAGSPLAYCSDNPADARAGVNLLGVVYDQGACGTCVNAVIASAATAAVAAALRVDASSLTALSHDHAYFCAHTYGEDDAQRSCGFGWGYENALRSMRVFPAAFFMNRTCLGGADLAQLSSTPAKLGETCNAAKAACGVESFTCNATSLSEGVYQVQRRIRSHGSALTRIKVTDEFKRFFESNRTGVFNTTTAPTEGAYFWHAVLLVGYNNTGFFWYARNSWGTEWADRGTFRIAYGALGVGHPEETYGLACDTNSSDPATLAAWSDPWPVALDPDAPGCYLYNATTKDTISGIADHFEVDVLQLVAANTRRLIIPTELAGVPPRPEPQLDGLWGGKVFQLCGIPQSIFTRVALVTCESTPEGGNATWGAGCSGLSAGKTCAGSCGVGLAGLPVALCDIDGRWTVKNGSCSPVVTCNSLPVGGSAVWSAACRGLPSGSSCNGTCAAGFTGVPTAACSSDGSWAVLSGCRADEYVKTLTVDGATYSLHVLPKRTWMDAQERCRQDGQQLLRLFSRQQGANVHKAVANFTAAEPYWIGLKDATQGGEWTWRADGATLSTAEANWGLLEPNNAGRREYCASANSDAEWSDISCDEALSFVCSDNITSACARFPCLAPATCTPLAAGPAATAAGRVCSCGAGEAYKDDVVGCGSHTTLDIGNGTKYALFQFAMTWGEADAYCKARGTNLVKITSKSQAVKLHKAVRNVLPSPAPGTSVWRRWSYWIGLNDRAKEGSFVWADGTKLTYERWSINNPDDFSGWEDCVSTFEEEGEWNDLSCRERRMFVCS